MKTCSKCKMNLPLNQFGKYSKNKDGLQYKCKNCINSVNRAYYADNNEKIKQQSAEWRKANKQKIKAYGKKFRDSNVEKQIQRRRKYRLENGQKLREYNEKYRLENLDKARQRESARRSRKNNNGVFKILNKELKKLYGSPCFYCGSTKQIHADHIVPVCKGGRHSIGNLIPACRKCNQSKSSKFLIEWKSQKIEKEMTNVRSG